jgi:hypothetical protein
LTMSLAVDDFIPSIFLALLMEIFSSSTSLISSLRFFFRGEVPPMK